jgi:hypothetical protein
MNVITPPPPRDVMIIPNAHVQNVTINTNLTVFQQNWRFAQQWLNHDAATRKVLELPQVSAQTSVTTAMQTFRTSMQAAASAAVGRDIVLFVGHGATQTGTSQAAFDSMPESGMMATHRCLINQDVLDLPNIAAKKPDGTWAPTPGTGVGHLTVSQAEVDAKSPRYDALAASGAAMKTAGVARFIILSCNVGTAHAFIDNLAGLLGVPVVGYQGFVAVGETEFTTGTTKRVLEQIWITQYHDAPSTDRPPDGDAAHPSFHEVPSYSQYQHSP